MTEPTEEMKAMARRVVATFYQNIRDHDYARWVLEGEKDNTTEVHLALAAIIEATEKCAELADTFPAGDVIIGNIYVGPSIATAIRSGKQYG